MSEAHTGNLPISNFSVKNYLKIKMLMGEEIGSLGSPAIFKWITNKVLVYSTGNSAQCYMAASTGGEFGGEWMHVYVWLSPFAVHLKLSQHF